MAINSKYPSKIASEMRGLRSSLWQLKRRRKIIKNNYIANGVKIFEIETRMEEIKKKYTR